MSDVVIRAEGLGKKYVIGHQLRQERNPTLRDTLARTAKGYLRSAQSLLRGQQLVSGDEVEEFWALKDVSFDIKRGDVVGIVGRNGAGKSTLLKVLSRITEPSEGRVEIRGRVASLLEVGTGFHPELTGRENIYLNGAILGMTRAEIRRNFDEIVAFAEIEKFLDTPVKRYSSGMYVRLAFAVAAHLDPEILIVDEVLAVGDAQFQKKCLGKMRDVAGSGRTVLFVSHNIHAVQELCSDGMYLKSGQLLAFGSIAHALSGYFRDRGSSPFQTDLSALPRHSGIGRVKFDRLELRDRAGNSCSVLETGQVVDICITLRGDDNSTRTGRITISVQNEAGATLLVFDSEVAIGRLIDIVGGRTYVCRIPKLPLTAGSYGLDMFLMVDGQVEDWIIDQSTFEVQGGIYFRTIKSLPQGWDGRVAISDHAWRGEEGQF